MNNTEYGFELHPELCIQCHACESACKNWRHTDNNIAWRRVVSVEKGSFPDVKISYYSIGCLHCVNPACIDACPTAAIAKKQGGAVVVDKDSCIGCGACESACPWGIPSFGADSLMQKCDMCESASVFEQKAPCARMCPSKALRFKEMTTEEKKQQEALMLAALK